MNTAKQVRLIQAKRAQRDRLLALYLANNPGMTVDKARALADQSVGWAPTQKKRRGSGPSQR